MTMLQPAGRSSPASPHDTFWRDPHAVIQPEPFSSRQITALPSWECLPDVGLTSKRGLGSDVDELADDDKEHPPKRQKTVPGFIAKRSRKRRNNPTWPSGSHSDGSFSTHVVQPGSNGGTTQLKAALNASFTNAATHRTLQGSTFSHKAVSDTRKRKAAVRSSTPVPSIRDSDSGIQRPPELKFTNPSGPVHPLVESVSRFSSGVSQLSQSSVSHLLRFSESVSVSTPHSSALAVTASSTQDLRRQPQRQARPIAAALGKPSTDYRANQDEIEEWAEATVASIVFRMPTSPKKIEANVRRTNGMKLMKAIENLSAETLAGGDSAMSTPNCASSIKPVAVPRISRSSCSEAIIESLFGREIPKRGPLVTKPSTRSKASSLSDMFRTNDISVSTPGGDHDRNPIDLPSTSPSTSTPSVQNLTAEISAPLGVQLAPVVEDLNDNGPPEDVFSTKNESSAGPEPTSPAVYPPSVHFTLRPDFEGLFGADPSSIHSEQLSPVPAHLTPVSPTGDFAEDMLATMPWNDVQVSPATERDRASPHEAEGPNLILDHVHDVIELVSPMVSEARDDYRGSPDFHHGLVTPPLSEIPLAADEPSNVLDARFHRRLDPVSDKMDVAYLDPEKTYGSQNDSSGLFTPTTDYALLPDVLSPSLPTPQIELSSFHDQCLRFAMRSHTTTLEDSSLFELSEAATKSKPIPTVFEPEHLECRFRDLWSQSQHGRELETRLMAQAVIGEVRSEVEIEGWGSSEAMDSDEEEIDELADDSDQNTVSATPSMAQRSRRRARKPRVLLDRAKVNHRSKQLGSDPLTGYFDSPEFQLAEDDDITEDDRLINPPMGLFNQVAQWTRALRCLLKGKRKLGDKDMLYLKDVLKKVHANHAHVQPSSSLAKTVLAVTNLEQEDIPNKDKLGLRSSAGKSVRAWEIYRKRDD